MHKKAFDLTTGACTSGEALHLRTFEVKVAQEDGVACVYVRVPAASDLDAQLSTGKLIEAALAPA
jgi:hypothetical protein